MTRVEIIAILALIISMISLGFSAYFGLRDRGRLRATSRFFPASEHGPIRIVVTLVNTGRRPILLRLIGGSDGKGKWSGHYLGDDKTGLRLGEHERHELTLEREDLVFFHPEDDDFIFETLWVEDSLGRRHAVRDGKINIRRVWTN